MEQELLQKLTGKRGVFYGRHSTDKQDIAWQIQLVDNFFEEVLHSKPIAYYSDEAVSARKTKYKDRAKLQHLIKDSSRGVFDFVVISSYDRIARNPIDHLKLREALTEKGIPVIIATTRTEYGKEDFLTRLLFDGISKYEADQTAQRTSDNINTLVFQGKWKGGRTPFGYVYHRASNTLKPDPIRREKVKEIFSMYEKGLGFKEIANVLNDEEKLAKPSWYKEKVKGIITNPIYAGVLTLYRREGNSGYRIRDRSEWVEHEAKCITSPIISKQQWENCWKIYSEKTKIYGKKKENQAAGGTTKLDTPFFLKKILYCTCGKMMRWRNYTNQKKVYQAYICDDCDYRVPCDLLHKKFEQEWNYRVTDSLLQLMNGKRKKLAEKELLILEESIKDCDVMKLDLKNEQNNFIDRKKALLRNSGDSDEAFVYALDLLIKDREKRISEINDQKDLLEIKKSKVSEFLEASPVNISLNFNDFSPRDKNELIRHYVLSCKVSRERDLEITFVNLE
ncbi:recombinase family protein [Alteribacter keqinensis]|uniref:recombinase family protein n=1 Tax=Alteribacter keqinensis TaxID=2483800 RepID=UPI001605F7E8|nr:recombinase family protein [Alteribacter keqinensis]